MRWFLVTLCCMMIIPSMVYAQSDVGTMNIEQEQYTLERTGDVLLNLKGILQKYHYLTHLLVEKL